MVKRRSKTERSKGAKGKKGTATRGNVEKRPVQVSNCVKFSLRVLGRVTSFTLRKDMIVLWFVFSQEEELSLKRIKEPEYVDQVIFPKINSFVFDCIGEWEGESGKGLSDFISKMLLEDIMDKKSFKIFSHLLENYR